MKVFRIYPAGIALVALNYLAMPPASLAQPQSLPAESSTAEGGGVSATSTGVVYPDKGGSIRREKIKDELPMAVRSQSEKDCLAQLKFAVDPRVQIQKYISTLKIPKERPILARGSVNYIESDALKSLFPTSVFYVLRFPQWPVAMEPPQPLGNNNIFVISKEAKELTLITDTNKERYKQFLIAKLPRIQSEQKAMQAVKAALVLVKELYQDGMFKFENEANSLYARRTGTATHAGGKLNVVPQGGNSGTLSVTIVTDGQGAVSDIKHESNLQEGMRPICQSTKLLDPDPIVRKMAEQDILIMGSPAKEYLDWQRTQVSPELRQAIDRIWERIIKEGR
jgi:hypothetical protein